MKVLVVSSNVGRTLSEITYNFVFDEIIRIAKRGLKVHVARSKQEGESCCYDVCFHDITRPKLQLFLSNINMIVRYPPLTWFRISPSLYFELAYSKHVADLIKKLRPEILHAHFAYPEGWASYIAIEASKTKTPFVVTLHGYDILVEPQVGYGIRLNKRHDLLVKRVLNEADAVIVASRAVYEEAKKIIDDYRKKLYLIPNGVDIRRFNPLIDGSKVRKIYNAEDKNIIFTLRHHEPKYGIVYLILAANIILRYRKDVIFIVGGDGPLRNYHMSLARRLGIEDHVLFPGRIPQNEVPLYYASSDIVVVPSLQEAWGLVATEAMACGKPVIASRVGGLPDQVIDGYNGFLVPPRDPKAIADKILYLLENPSEMKRMGLNGRRLAEEKFDIEKRVDKIIRLYKTLLRG
ncbi:glycosyltransferase [Thermosphaera sp.]